MAVHMTEAQKNLENIRKAASGWHKLLQIRKEGEQTIVTIVRGFRGGESPEIFADDWRLATSPELDAFLASPEIQQKLYQPSKRGIVLVDIAGYSKYDTKSQSAILSMFYEGLRLSTFSNDLFSRDSNVDQVVPTGDGCYIIYKPNVADRVLRSVFGIHASFYIHQMRMLRGKTDLKAVEPLGIRFACHVGEVDFIVDAAEHRNAYGTGLNEAARILAGGREALKKKTGEDPTGVVYFDKVLEPQAKPFCQHFASFKNISLKLVDFGRVKVKHDLEFDLQCLTGLPKNVGLPFNYPLEKDGFTPHPTFMGG